MVKFLMLILLLHTTSLFSYTPVITPNGSTLPWVQEGDAKAFHLIAEPVKRTFAPGFDVNCWGYNGQTPGPTIEAVEGDLVRIYVTNKLPEPTTVHWHGIILPNRMDGVSGLTQAPIPPGKTMIYEFPLRQSGTYMYHPHYDEITQIAFGMVGFFIIHPKDPKPDEIVDRDYAIMLGEWFIPPGGATPDPMKMDFNYFTFNSTVWPGTEPLIAQTGEKVRMRFGNLSLNSHPIHLHGVTFTVTAHGGRRMPRSAQYDAVTVNVPVGDTRTFEFIANNPGDWALHCHKTHHTMNGMSHDIPNLINVDQRSLTALHKFFPHYHPMGQHGNGQMFEMPSTMPLPPNFLHRGTPGPFGIIEMSGMFTVFKVRDQITNDQNIGWYQPNQ